MRILLMLLGANLLGGCAIGPQTKDELYSDYGYLEKRCSNSAFDDSYKLISTLMESCVAQETSSTIMAGNMLISSSSSVTIQKEYSPEKATISAYGKGGPGHYMYTTVVKLAKSNECKTDIEIYGMSSMNKKDLELIDWWLAGNKDCEPK